MKTRTKISTNTREEKGFALLFAVLTASVLLSIGLSIFNLTVKELVLSSSGRESQFAFYAADTGAECALYWDLLSDARVFATSTPSSGPVPTDASCVDSPGAPQRLIDSNSWEVTGNSSSATTRFDLIIPNSPAPYCAVVIVTKSNNGSRISTEIDSRGYNTCVEDDKTRVERALKVSY